MCLSEKVKLFKNQIINDIIDYLCDDNNSIWESFENLLENAMPTSSFFSKWSSINNNLIFTTFFNSNEKEYKKFLITCFFKTKYKYVKELKSKELSNSCRKVNVQLDVFLKLIK